MNLESLQVSTTTSDVIFPGEQVISVLGATQRGVQRLSYDTANDPAIVYVTVYSSDGISTLTDRTPLGVIIVTSYTGYRLYAFDQVVGDNTDLLVFWDEGDPAVYKAQWVVVDTRVGGTVQLPQGGPPPSAIAPGPPGTPIAVATSGQATVTWTAPLDNGGAPILSYTITAADSTTAGNGGQGFVSTDGSLSATITGLVNGDAYTFTVSATNAVGSGPPSNPSNSVTPAAVVTTPGPPLNPQATAGNGQITVAFSAPTSNGGSAITTYRVSAVNEINGNIDHASGASSPITVSGLVNTKQYHATVRATNAIGNGPESVQTNSVTPSSATAVATFSAAFGPASVLTLDASGSVGTLVWNIDGVNASGTGSSLVLGPMIVGRHHIKLTATAGTAAVTERDVDVPYVFRPLTGCQHDGVNGLDVNGNPQTFTWGTPSLDGTGTKVVWSSTTGVLPKWSPLPAIGPWRNKVAINSGGAPPGDGVERIHVYDDNHIYLLTKFGDRPDPSGGYRSSCEWNNSYGQNVTMPGHEFQGSSTFGLTNIMGHKPFVGTPPSGSGLLCDGHSDVRFWRISLMLPSSNPNPLLYQNNVFEIDSGSGGAPLRIEPDGAGTNLRVGYSDRSGSTTGPTKQWDYKKIVWDAYYHYVIEMKLDIDPAAGYIRVYRDYNDGLGMRLVPVSLTPDGTKGKSDGTPSTDPEYGKFYCKTQQTDTHGNAQAMSMDLQNYRTRTSMDGYYISTGQSYPDVLVHYQNVIVGPTLASVMI